MPMAVGKPTLKFLLAWIAMQKQAQKKQKKSRWQKGQTRRVRDLVCRVRVCKSQRAQWTFLFYPD